LGSNGSMIAIDHFGASAPANILFEKFGFTVENIIIKAQEIIK
jgi:transketolase